MNKYHISLLVSIVGALAAGIIIDVGPYYMTGTILLVTSAAGGIFSLLEMQ